MEGITYPEHLAPGVSPVVSLVARPQVEIKTSLWKPVIHPDTDINTDGLLMKKFPYPAPLEQSVLEDAILQSAPCGTLHDGNGYVAPTSRIRRYERPYR